VRGVRGRRIFLSTGFLLRYHPGVQDDQHGKLSVVRSRLCFNEGSSLRVRAACLGFSLTLQAARSLLTPEIYSRGRPLRGTHVHAGSRRERSVSGLTGPCWHIVVANQRGDVDTDWKLAAGNRLQPESEARPSAAACGKRCSRDRQLEAWGVKSARAPGVPPRSSLDQENINAAAACRPRRGGQISSVQTAAPISAGRAITRTAPEPVTRLKTPAAPREPAMWTPFNSSQPPIKPPWLTICHSRTAMRPRYPRHCAQSPR